MVTIVQPTRLFQQNSRSSEPQSSIGSFENVDEQDNSRRAALIVSQDTAERFMADDLFALSEWLFFIRPLSRKRPIFLRLVRASLVIQQHNTKPISRTLAR